MAGTEASDIAHDFVQQLTPSLRRFARALAADRDGGLVAEELLKTALDRLPSHGSATAHLKTALYAGIVHTYRNRPLAAATDAPSRARHGIVQQIDRLPLDQREVLLLVVLERLRYDEVAAILSLPRSSVVARLARARAALAPLSEETPSRPAYLRVVK